jgi:hypothetical protein
MERPANQGTPVQVTCSPSPQTPTIRNELLTLRKPEQNKNNYKTRSNFASELEIENIDKEIQNLDFDPEKIEVTQRMSDEDFKAEIALVTTAPKVMTSSAEAVASPKS